MVHTCSGAGLDHAVPLAPPPPPLRLSTRPALAVAAALAVGIGLAASRPGVSPLVWASTAFVGTLAAVAYGASTRGRLVTLRPLVVAAAVVVAAVALGAARMAVWSAPPPDDVSHLAEAAWRADSLGDRAPITIWGTVADVPTRTWAVRFTLEADSAARGARRGPVRGRTQVSLLVGEAGAVYPALRPGDRVRLEGTLEPPPPRRNPAQFDYGAYLRRQGVGATLEVRDETGAQFLAPSRQPATVAAEAVRRHVRRTLARHVPGLEARSLLHALLLADRSRVEAGTLEAFRRTGLMHLLAVSGLHVGLVGGVLYLLLKPLLGRLGLRRRQVEWTRALVTLSILAVYVLVAGASVSIRRAFLMVALLIVGRPLERPSDALNTLGVAAVVILLGRPAALFDVGFQLSFGAVAALVTLTPLLTGWLPETVRRSKLGMVVAGSVVTSVAATIGTAPALLAHFGRLPIGGIVLNVPAIPLTAATLGSGLGCALLAPVPPLAAAFGALADVSGRLLIALTETGDVGLGGVAAEGFLEAPTAILASALAVLALALWMRPLARNRAMVAAGACLAVGLWTGFAQGEARRGLDVVFLDVGQGDATLVSTPAGRHVLIDAGLRSPYVDEGERTVLPHLERFGVRGLDALVLTHADADHVGGARSVLEAVPVGRLVVNGAGGETDLWRSVLEAADSLGVPVESVGAGDTLNVDPAVRIRVLGPAGPMSSPNDASVALRLEHGRTRWLLTGDAEAAGEADLVAHFPDLLGADVVKVGHHGSRTSSTPTFVDATREPSFAVVSVARRNRYGLPDEEPLARWASTGAAVLLTSAEGAVWLRSDGATVERVAWRDD